MMLLMTIRNLVLAYTMAALPAIAAPDYDLVIQGGRVIDPETKLDSVRDVGITGGTIVSVSDNRLSGRRTIDASGLVVAPGFIDVHSHTPTLLGQHMNLLDGVTTQLELEASAYPIDFYGEHYAGGAQLNYGSSVGHFAIRTKVIEGRDQPYVFVGHKVATMGGPAWMEPATPEQIETMRGMLHRGLDEGGLGIGVLLDYMTAAVSAQELRMLFEVAADREVPIYVHVRRGYTRDPAGLIEVVDLAKDTGAALFVCHITHKVAANAVYGDRYKQPTGIPHVIVGGRQVVADSVRIEGRYPGKKILGEVR